MVPYSRLVLGALAFCSCMFPAQAQVPNNFSFSFPVNINIFTTIPSTGETPIQNPTTGDNYQFKYYYMNPPAPFSRLSTSQLQVGNTDSAVAIAYNLTTAELFYGSKKSYTIQNGLLNSISGGAVCSTFYPTSPLTLGIDHIELAAANPSVQVPFNVLAFCGATGSNTVKRLGLSCPMSSTSYFSPIFQQCTVVVRSL